MHLCSDKSKHHPRDRYLVTSIDGNWCQVRMFVGSQLRANPYKIPLNEVYRVPSPRQVRIQLAEPEDEEWDESSNINTSPAVAATAEVNPPQEEISVAPIERDLYIPPEITLPPDDDTENCHEGAMDSPVEHVTSLPFRPSVDEQ